MKRDKKLFVLKEYNKDGTYSYTKRATSLSVEWANKVNQDVKELVKKGVYKYGFEWVLMPDIPEWYGMRHICMLRSICETFEPNAKEPHCTCGKVYDDPVHFTSDELDNMTKEEKLFL